MFSVSGLTDPVLEAAANKGLLRRAHRDRAAGLVQRVAADDTGAELRVDGETVRLSARGLAAANCTCPAPGICRHILAAVIELREGDTPGDAMPAATQEAIPAAPPEAAPLEPAPLEPAPAEPAGDAVAEMVALPVEALAKAFGRAALTRAEALLAAAGGGITVERAPGTCVVRIPGQPPVHYLAGFGPGGMVSKESDARVLHAAALLAVRRIEAGQAVVPADTAPAPAPRARTAELAFLDSVASALRDAARAALAHAPAVLQQRLLDLAVSSRAAALPNLAGGLRAVAADMAQRRVRAASFDAADALAALARCYALAEALRRADDPALRGAASDSDAPLPALDLIGCGVQLWARGGARGATAYLLAPNAPDGPRWFYVTLARGANQDITFDPAHAAAHEPVWGTTLDALGRGAFRLDGASAGPDGRIAPARTARATRDPTPWPDAIHQHEGQAVRDWRDLAGQLHRSFVPSLRQVRAPVRPVVLAPTTLGLVQFDPLAQVAWLPAADATGRWLRLQLGDADGTDTRLDALAAAMSGSTPPLLVALARPDGDALVLDLIAASRTDGVLEYLDRPLPRAAPAGGLLARLRRGLDTLGRSVNAADSGPRFEPVPRRAEATDRILAAAADESLALAELGGRMDDPARLERLRALAERLQAAGLQVLATPLQRLAEAAAADRPHHLLVFTHALRCCRHLAVGVPLVRRVA